MTVVGPGRSGREQGAYRTLLPVTLILAALAVAVLPAATGRAGASAASTSAGRSSASTLQGLPRFAQAAISRVLGRDQTTYRAGATREGVVVRNAAQRLSARFSAGRVEVSSGATRFSLSLRALGYGSSLERAARALPHAQANRVSYRRGPLEEWYVNGPLGLEQGFTLGAPLPGRGHGPLTLSLALSGNAASLLPGGGLGFSGSSLRYQGLVASDGRGKSLRAWLELHGRTLLLRVSDANARYPLTIDPFVQQAKLVSSESAQNNLGYSVAVSGDTVAVGVFAAVNGNSNQGAVYVFVKPGGGWASGTETAKLTASDGAAGDLLGYSAAIDGDTVVAGAPGATVGGNPDQGAAYVFVKPGGGWAGENEAAKLIQSDPLSGGGLGDAVAVSGNTVVASTYYPNTNLRGAAYVFVEPGGGWAGAGTLTEDAKLTASDAANGDDLGISVAISGDTVVAGAPNADVGGANSDHGAAYVFVKQGGGWADKTQDAKLTASDGATGDQLGYSVGISGDTVVAGAPKANFCGASSGLGAAYVFVEPGTSWSDEQQNAELTASDGAANDMFGYSVAIDGDTIVAGAPCADVGVNFDDGAAYVYVKSGAWTNLQPEAAKLLASDSLFGENLGWSVAVSGDTIVAGAPYADVGGNTDEGAAYVFVRPLNGWVNGTETAKLIEGGVAIDHLGYSVAVDGDTVAVGAPDADVGPDSSRGAVFVFVKPGTGWASGIQTAELTASDGVSDDQLGWSVAVEGDTVIAGARNAGLGRGAAYVFVRPFSGEWSSESETAKLTADDAQPGDQLGSSVSISGDTAVAGAPGADVDIGFGPTIDQGAAYLFYKPGSWFTGTEIAKLIASDGAANDQFGYSVAVDGNTIVAGATFADVGPGPNPDQGAAYVFLRPVGLWTAVPESAKLIASDGAPFDQLGWSVALSGDTAVVGAPYADIGGNSDQGAAYVFDTSGAQLAKLTASGGAAGDQLGYAVDLDGGTAVAGAPGADVGANLSQGAAYLYAKPGGGWATNTQTQKLTASDGAQNDSLGTAVAVSVGTVVAGAPYATVDPDPQEGAAYVFQGGTTAVRLVSFAARRGRNAVVLRWRTGTEVGLLGFDVFRQSAGRLVHVNRNLVPTASTGAHRFVDRTAPRVRPLRYRLQAVNLDGTRRWLGTARA